MKNIIICIVLSGIVFSCANNSDQKDKVKEEIKKDTAQKIFSDTTTTPLDTTSRKEVIKSDTIKPKTANKDSVLLVLRKEILTAIKNKDYVKLASFIHPIEGLRFSPYSCINYNDSTHDNKENTTVKELLQWVAKKNKMVWGGYDGSGDDILLNVHDYFKAFVYDRDFLNAKEISINKIIDISNSQGYDLSVIYKGCDFIESHFPNTEGYSDWRTLRLVFKKYNDKYYLIGIEHDQWMI